MDNNILKRKSYFVESRTFVFFCLMILVSVSSVFPQTNTVQDSLLGKATLQDCVQYALVNQPSIQQSLLDEEIAAKEVHSKLADWFPQLNLNVNFQHNYRLQTSIIQGNLVRFGVINTSNAQFTLTQTIFDRDVLLASSTAGEVEQQAAQTTTEKKINLVVNVSKAFYSALLSHEQLDLVNQDLTRLKQSQQDAYYQYKSGVVDKTDYMRATIAFNNAKAEQKQDSEAVKTSYSFLKEQMGYPDDKTLDLVYDRNEMENNIYVDTIRSIDFTKRIEYQLLQTAKSLQESNLDYYDWSFIPSLSVFGAYNFNFMNDKLSELYQKNYPTSYIGLQLSFPIFEGGKRIQQIQQASLELKRSEYDIQSFKNTASANYVQALSSYKSNLNNYNVQKENLDLAKQVYNTIELQYKSGIKTYLDVITAETDLRTTEVNYISALYQVLSSKLDVQKALGEIKY
jgi:outer membrane protein TolC